MECWLRQHGVSDIQCVVYFGRFGLLGIGATRVASVSSCQEFPPRPVQPMPAFTVLAPRG